MGCIYTPARMYSGSMPMEVSSTSTLVHSRYLLVEYVLAYA